MLKNHQLIQTLKNYTGGYAAVVPFNPALDKLLKLDFTENNKYLSEEILNNTGLFSNYIEGELNAAGARYGIGGYAEHRTIYKRSSLFSPTASNSPSPNTISLGQDGAKAPSRWEGENESAFTVEEETVGYRYADPLTYGLLKDFALKHRTQPTEPEEVMWNILRTKKLEGFKFRRQHIIDRFIADFVCLKEKLVIEIDGLIHSLPEHQISDKERTERLNQLGFQVIRFDNEQVLHNTENVIQQTLSSLKNKQDKNENSNLSSPTGGQGAEPRRLHLGVDIWGAAETPVYAPLRATVHSFAFNAAFGDYGATLILAHQLNDVRFYTLYGHLSLGSIENKQEGQTLEKGALIAFFGEPEENGHWPPHLHFQVIENLDGYKGDYPGVCAFSEKETYLANCPDANLILNLIQFAEPPL